MELTSSFPTLSAGQEFPLRDCVRGDCLCGRKVGGKWRDIAELTEIAHKIRGCTLGYRQGAKHGF